MDYTSVRKTIFAWASIAGADPEPVELVRVDGRDGIFTLGCADPFWLDDPTTPIKIFTGTPLVRPLNPQTQEEKDAALAVWRASRHGWRGSR